MESLKILRVFLASCKRRTCAQSLLSHLLFLTTTNLSEGQSSFLFFFSVSFSHRIILFSHPPALPVFARLTGAAIDNKRYASHELAKY